MPPTELKIQHAKQANYSKTIKIPASKEINEVFDRIFDLGTSLSTSIFLTNNLPM
jgi:signal transduction histidine kinase